MKNSSPFKSGQYVFISALLANWHCKRYGLLTGIGKETG